MKTHILLFPILAFLVWIPGVQNVFAQTSDGRFIFYSEVVPYAILYGGQADGYQIGAGCNLVKGKYTIQLTYGVRKRTYELSDQVAAPLVNGMPIVDKTTDASIFTPENEQLGGVPDISLFQHLEEAGIRHYVPRDGAYVTNYGSLEILRNYTIKNKWAVSGGLGGQIGLMNRTEAGGGLSDSVNYFGQPIKTWITYRISARYLYYGFTSRVSLTRKISSHFSVGIGAGIHIIMAKNSTDDVMPYFSLLARCSI